MPSRLPIIFWLLLAATISVDVVVFSQAAENGSVVLLPASIYTKAAFDALLESELSVVCIWAVLSSKKILWTPIFVATAMATLLAAMVNNVTDSLIGAFWLYLSLYGLVPALLVTVLWLFRRSNYWRRRTGVTHDLRYSLAQLLIAMTIVAVLATTMRRSPFYGDDKWANIRFACSVVAFAIAAAFIWSLPWHWLLRLAATLGVAILFGIAISLATGYGSPFSPHYGALYLIQAIVLSAWLGWGPILPPPTPSPGVDA